MTDPEFKALFHHMQSNQTLWQHICINHKLDLWGYTQKTKWLQFSGMYDSTEYGGGKGNKIFEHDTVKVRLAGGSETAIGIVKIVDGCFDVQFDNPVYDKPTQSFRDRIYVKSFVVNHAITVIGNIHEDDNAQGEDK